MLKVGVFSCVLMVERRASANYTKLEDEDLKSATSSTISNKYFLTGIKAENIIVPNSL